MLKDVLTQKGLSNREAEVAELVTKGLSNKEVANQLFVTEKTVKFHLTNIYKKMSVKSRSQLIVWCMPHMSFQEADTEIRPVTQVATISNGPANIAGINSSVVQPIRATQTLNPGANPISILPGGNQGQNNNKN